MDSLYGLIGEKLGHSRSKEIHRRIFKELGIDAYYHLFEIEPSKLHKIPFALDAIGAVGVNVTIPYKIEIMKYLDNISEEAKNIGAINTIRFSDGQTTGFNTDYLGFGKMLDKFGVEVRGKKVVILGSGGAADAVLQFFLDSKCDEVYVISRNLHEAGMKYQHKDVLISSYNDLNRITNKDILVNCTPCGMHPNIEETPLSFCTAGLPEEIFRNYTTAVDLIYNPNETLFLKQAAQAGLNTVNGLYMLVAQAFAAQEIWQQRILDTKILDLVYEALNNSEILG